MDNDELGSGKTVNPVLCMLTSTRTQYLRDALDLLAYPSGIDYRFRYHVKYLHSNIFPNKIESLVGQTSILIHVYTEELAGKPDRVLEFIPIRKATIVEVKNLGDFVQISFTLGDWVIYDKFSNDVDVNSYHHDIRNSMPAESKDGFVYGCLFVDEFSLKKIPEDLSDKYDAVVSNWSKIISHIAKLPPHKNSVFLKLLEIKSIHDDTKLKPKEFDSMRGFELSSDKTYQIEILQRLKERPLPAFNLKIETNLDDINIIKETALIQGRYDILKFIISTEDFARPQNSFFMIRLDKEKLDFISSYSFYHVKIKPRLRKLVPSLVILGGGLILTALGNTIAGYFNIESLSTTLNLGGGIASFVGAFMMPKKKII